MGPRAHAPCCAATSLIQLVSCMCSIAHTLAQVHLPLFDPAELLLLAVFRDPGATSTASRMFGSGASLVGKLRLRLSTLAADAAHAAALPLCADRKAGGGRAATAHLRVKVCKPKV